MTGDYTARLALLEEIKGHALGGCLGLLLPATECAGRVSASWTR